MCTHTHSFRTAIVNTNMLKRIYLLHSKKKRIYINGIPFSAFMDEYIYKDMCSEGVELAGRLFGHLFTLELCFSNLKEKSIITSSVTRTK